MSRARLSGLQIHNMGHNGHGTNMYVVFMIFMDKLFVGGHADRKTPSTPVFNSI